MAYPQILVSSDSTIVLTLDNTSPLLYVHTAVLLHHGINIKIINGTVTLPTTCFEAASLMLQYCYMNGQVEKEAHPASVLFELVVLAEMLQMPALSESVYPVLKEKVESAGVEELAQYTRANLRHGFKVSLAPAECWLSNKKRLKQAVQAKEGEQYLQEVMLEYPSFALELLDGVLDPGWGRRERRKK